MENNWYWEGNVQETILNHLTKHGWTIVRSANTATKEPGSDIEATMANRRLLIEVKGFPSTGYQDVRRILEKKHTNPSVQAPIWYAQALLKAIRLQYAHPAAEVAIGLPVFPRYIRLLTETIAAVDKLGIVAILVWEDGAVRTATNDVLSQEIQKFANKNVQSTLTAQASLPPQCEREVPVSTSSTDRIAAHLQSTSAALCDDCLSERLRLSARQVANQVCRQLFADRRIRRANGLCAMCFKSKIVNQRLIN